MTGQDLLDRMEVLNNELKLQAGENGVTRGLTALNMAQDYMETLMGQMPRLLGGQTGTVVTAANTESTSYPSGLLRVDKLQLLDPDTSRPKWTLDRIDELGDHAPSTLRELIVSAYISGSGTPGPPTHYVTDGTLIYWAPLPDAVHTVRWYGFQRQSDITAGGTFAYDDGVSMPVALFAVELLKRGLDDPIGDYLELADRIFRPTLRMLKRFRRERAPMRQYRYRHYT